MYLAIITAGFGGGLVRGLIGFVKHQYSYKNVGFNVPYFFVMAFVSGVVGLLVAGSGEAMGLNFLGGGYTPAFAFVVGYAGGDFVENVFKIITKTDYLFKNNEQDWLDNRHYYCWDNHLVRPYQNELAKAILIIWLYPAVYCEGPNNEDT